MESPKKVIIFLSGRGSNFKSLLEFERSTPDCPYVIVGVFSDKPLAPGLDIARQAGIPVFAFDRQEYRDFASFKQSIFQAADTSGADLVALAGYMQIVPDWFVSQWEGKLINIHPSLLPKFAGLDTHERALTANEKVHGCSVHFVDSGVDTGPLIAQSTVEVLASDTAQTLAAKVLVKEHELYPWALSKVAQGAIALKAGRIVYAESAYREGLAKGYTLFAS